MAEVRRLKTEQLKKKANTAKKPAKQITLHDKIKNGNVKFYDLLMPDEGKPRLYLSLIFNKEYFSDVEPFLKENLQVYFCKGNDKDGITLISASPISKEDGYYGILVSQVMLPIYLKQDITVDKNKVKLFEVDMVKRIAAAKRFKIKI